MVSLSGADAKCNSDENAVQSRFGYKAFLVDGDAREITGTPGSYETSDWVFKPNTRYVQRSGAEFAKTLSLTQKVQEFLSEFFLNL